MKRLLLLLSLVVGCDYATPSNSGTSYALASIDTKPLPTTLIGWPPNQLIEAAHLEFEVGGRPHDGSRGLVTYQITVSGQTNRSTHHFVVANGILHIDLCPLQATCLAIPMELVGPIEEPNLVLTYSLGGMASSVLRFGRVLLD